MSTLLRLGGILLLFGELLFSVGRYASIQRAQIESAQDIIADVSAAPQSSEVWVSLAPNIGIALMALGVLLAAVAVLFMFIRAMRTSETYVSYGGEGRKLTVSSAPTLDARTIWQTGDIVAILNTVLQVEYANVVNWPRWVNRIGDKTAVERLSPMARDSIRHFDTVCALIGRLGGIPLFGFELPKDEADLRKTLLGQLEKEKLLKLGYQKASGLASEEGLRKVLIAQEAAEDEHITILEEVLSEFASPAAEARKSALY